MKKFLFPALLSALLFLLPASPLPASAAESGYCVVASRSVRLYASPGGDPLFLLPYTYCVKILEKGEEYSAVRYGEDGEGVCAVEGYCRTDDLTPLSFVPETPFLDLKIEISYEAPLPASPFGEDLFRKSSASFAYYGVRYAEGGECYRYLYGKDPATGRYAFAYLKGEEPDYPLNEDYLPTPSAGEESAVQSRGGLTAAQIVAICVGCAAVVGVAVLLLRGKAAPREEVSDF